MCAVSLAAHGRLPSRAAGFVAGPQGAGRPGLAGVAGVDGRERTEVGLGETTKLSRGYLLVIQLVEAC